VTIEPTPTTVWLANLAFTYSEMEAGYHEVKFDGNGLSSSVYFYRIEAGSFVQTRKLMLLR
jgi:hypothetical protein